MSSRKPPSRLDRSAAGVVSGDGVIISVSGGWVEVRVLSEGIVRVRLSRSDVTAEPFSYALDPDAELARPDGAVIEEGADGSLIRNGNQEIYVSHTDGRVRASYRGQVLSLDAAPPKWDLGLSQQVELSLTMVLHPEERLLGLGDKTAGIDRRGGRFRHWNTDAFGFRRGTDPLYKSIPFILRIMEDGTAHGLFVDSFAPSTFDLGHAHDDELRIDVETDDLTYYLLHADSPVGVIERYAALTGRAPMLPRWALGYHQCRYSYRTEVSMRRVAREIRERAIPCDTLYFDIHYMDGFRVFSWDKAAFPDPERLIRDLRRDGFTTVAIVDPGVACDDPDDAVIRSGMQEDVFVKESDGRAFAGVVWPGMCHFPDFHQSAARAWWGRHLSRLLDTGIDGIWCDMNEPSVFVEQMGRKRAPRPERTMPDDVMHIVDGEPANHRASHNAYGQQMHRATFEGMMSNRPQKRPFTITRAAYAGSQRYGSTWTGDNAATWAQLRLGLEQLLSLNVSGFPICGTDVGGFSGTPTGELMARWTQAGILSPLFRNHSSVETPRQEPWLFGDEIEDACRQAIELRYRLLPYLYTALRHAAVRGTPILSPLDLMHPHDPIVAKDRPFGMYLGDSLLAYPVLARGRRSVKAYFPDVAGGWFDFHTGERVVPGWHRVDAPLDRLPLFVRAGTVLPLGPVVQSTAELADQPITLQVYPRSGPFESVLYDDAGDGWGHESGQYLCCTFRGEGSDTTLTLRVAVDGEYGAPWSTVHVEVYGMNRSVREVAVDGTRTDFHQQDDVVSATIPFGASLAVH